MIIDIEKAVKDYLEENMVFVVGNGNGSIGVYRRVFPDDGNVEAISISAPVRESHVSVYEFEYVGLRILTRTNKEEKTFILTQNLDDLFDRFVGKNLNSDVKLCLCKRNSGPTFFRGEGDNFYYGTILYNLTIRYRGND